MRTRSALSLLFAGFLLLGVAPSAFAQSNGSSTESKKKTEKKTEKKTILKQIGAIYSEDGSLADTLRKDDDKTTMQQAFESSEGVKGGVVGGLQVSPKLQTGQSSNAKLADGQVAVGRPQVQLHFEEEMIVIR